MVDIEPALRFRVADVVRVHGPRHIERHGARLSTTQLRTLDGISRCRTASMGAHAAIYSCGHQVIAYNSCRVRGCTNCGRHLAAEWVEGREQDLLPITYFHIVFTLPPALRDVPTVARWKVYDALFRASSATLARFAREKLHGEPGVVSVLHTWGQNLSHHPHVHCVVAGGAWDAQRKAFIKAPNPRFLFSVRAMSKVFRGKMIADLRKHGLPGLDDEALARTLSDAATADWVVYAKPPFGGPRQVLRYLARYVHRVAIGDSRLVDVNDTSVTFRMKDYRDGGRNKLMTLDGDEFLRRFLQHIPPRGFVRIRSSGFLANTVKRDRLVAIRQALGVAAPSTPPAKAPPPPCPHCGATFVQRLEVLPRVPPQSLLRRPDTS